MKVKSNAKHNYCHARLNDNYKLEMFILRPNEIKEVPDEVAKSWIKTGEVIEYIEPKDVKKVESENKALKDEIKKLKAQSKAQGQKQKTTRKKNQTKN
jgi:uncharacterized phage protein (TIGR02220 family)